MFYSIKPFALSRLTNAYHIAFMGIVKQIIEDNGAELLGIDEKMKTKLDQVLRAEEDVVNKARKSNLTNYLNVTDEKRDKYFRSIHYHLLLSVIKLKDDPNNHFVATSLENHFIEQYPLSICNERSQNKTAKYRGLLHDLKTRMGGILETLGIESDMAALKEANDDYEHTYLERLNERSDAVSTASLRTATEDAFHQICFQISYIANQESNVPEDMLKIESCQTAIQSINQLIKDYKSKLKDTGGLTNEGLTPDPSLESEGSEMLNDSGEANSEPIRE